MAIKIFMIVTTNFKKLMCYVYKHFKMCQSAGKLIYGVH